MGIDTRLQVAAQRTIHKFASPIGQSTFKEFRTFDYDDDAGIVSNIYEDDQLIYIAFDALDADSVSISKSTIEDPNLPEIERVCFIAGLDVTVDVKAMDRIVAKDDGQTYQVEKVETDMYRALFTCELSLVI